MQVRQSTKKTEKEVKEAEIQTKFFKIIRSDPFLHEFPDAKWIHSIPNGARVGIGQAVKLKAQGLLSGVYDVFVPVARSPYHGMYIEFKTKRGKRSDSQKAFSKYCALNNYLCIVSSDAQLAAGAVRSYLGERSEHKNAI